MSSISPIEGLHPSDSIDPHPSQEWVHGRIVGIELPVTDLPRARKFYERIFKWRFFTYGDSGVVHFTSGSVTGIVHQVEDESFHYTIYHDHSKGSQVFPTGKRIGSKAVTFTIQVEDMEETLREVEREVDHAKGHVWEGPNRFRDNPPGRDGYVAYIRDTEDNIIGLRSVDAV